MREQVCIFLTGGYVLQKIHILRSDVNYKNVTNGFLNFTRFHTTRDKVYVRDIIPAWIFNFILFFENQGCIYL